MTLAFILTMPNAGSWNGKWTGEDRVHAIVKNYGNAKKTAERLQPLLDEGSFYYGWNDGWGASVSVREVDAKEARKLRKNSVGFSGYDWMVESLLIDGRIITHSDRQKEKVGAAKGGIA